VTKNSEKSNNEQQHDTATDTQVAVGAQTAQADSPKVADAENVQSDSSKKAAEAQTDQAAASEKKELCLSSVYAFKLGMSSIYDDKNRWVPVTFLQFQPWLVSQIKRKEKEGYNSLQLACMPQKNQRCSKALVRHLSPAGFKEGASYVREIRQENLKDVCVGQSVSIRSLQKGDVVQLSGISKGRGFAGVVKRWGFRGGPASHGGSSTLRSGGSVGNRTEPARVMPGRKMPGHYGTARVSVRNVKVMDVLPDQRLIVVKGAVPGARNSLVLLQKTSGA